MSEILNNLEDIINIFTDEGTKNWKKLLEVSQQIDVSSKRKYLWAWPTEDNLRKLKLIFDELRISCILSVGCGCGLLEWIIKESIGINIFGLEIDKSWWKSYYAIKSFIPTNYADSSCLNELPVSEYMKKCCNSTTCNFALLFCYFNNHESFLNYVNVYEGKWVILIGPKEGIGIHTDPSALEPNFPIPNQWNLSRKTDFGLNDILAIYERQSF